MKSRFAAGEYRQGDVHCIDLDRGVFKIRSSRDNMVIYSVQLQTPSCTCEAWRKTNFPCKHFYAVFNTFDEWDFSRLPESYRNNVFITLDPDVVDSISVDSEDKPQRQVKFDNRASTGNEDNDIPAGKTTSCLWLKTSPQMSNRKRNSHLQVFENQSEKRLPVYVTLLIQ